MIVAGIMSGTSADGIDVAIVDVRGSEAKLRLELLAHHHVAYDKKIRKRVFQTMNADSISVAELARLNFFLAELYAEAIQAAQREAGIESLDLAGCHGQTIYHQGERQLFAGRKLAVTWQLGEGSVLAARLGCPVVSDFRPADMAAGGKGAPLVPYFDYALLRDAKVGRILLNIGGIANLTAIPARAEPETVTAFDCGPGNMVMDALMQKLYRRHYDADGRVAASGRVLPRVLEKLLHDDFFQQEPPRTAGREQFGAEYVARFLKLCGKAKKEDILCTATALTATSIALSVEQFVLARTGPWSNFRELIVSGGGANNRTLLGMLNAALAAYDLKLRRTEDFGMPIEAKEAAAFALLAYETFHRRPSNLPSATGATQPAVLGKLSFPPGA